MATAAATEMATEMATSTATTTATATSTTTVMTTTTTMTTTTILKRTRPPEVCCTKLCFCFFVFAPLDEVDYFWRWERYVFMFLCFYVFEAMPLVKA